MADIFISYSRKDIAFARLLNAALNSSGLDTWIDWNDIPVGENWWNEIQQAIQKANVFMFIISKHSLESNVCHGEIDFALKNNKRIIPIVVDNLSAEVVNKFVPDLNKINWIIFEKNNHFEITESPLEDSGEGMEAVARDPQFQQAMEKLDETIHKDWDWVKYHTQLQNDAARWQASKNNKSYLLRGKALSIAETEILQSSHKEPQPTELQKQFILTSRKIMTRRKLILTISLILGVIFAAIIGVIWYTQTQNALAKELLSQSTKNSRDVDLLLTLESLKLNDTADTRNALLNQMGFGVRSAYLHGHTDSVTALAYSPDGTIIASAGADKDRQIIFWDADTGKMIGDPLKKHTMRINTIAFSPDGKWLASGSTDMSIIIWDVKTHQIVGEPLTKQKDGISCIVFNPVKPEFASASVDHTIVIWSKKTLKPIQTIQTDKNSGVLSLAYSPDGSLLAAGSSDGKITFYKTDNFKQDGESLQKSTNEITQLLFSPDGKTMASGSSDSTVDLWNIEDRQLIGHPLANHTSAITGLAFSPDGNFLLASSLDGTLIVWSVEAQTMTNSVFGFSKGQITSFAFNMQGDSYALGYSDHSVFTVEFSDSAKTLTGHSYTVSSVAYDPTGKLLASGSYDNSILLWDVQTGKQLAKLVLDPKIGVVSLAFDPTGKILAAGYNNDTVALWDLRTYKQVGKTMGNPITPDVNIFDITSVVFDRSGKFLYTSEYSGTINKWDLSSFTKSKELVEKNGDINSMKSSPDGKFLAAGGYERVAFWNLNTDKEEFLIDDAVNGVVQSLAFSPDGKYLAVAGEKNTINVFELSTKKKIAGPLTGHVNTITSLDYSPDGKILASASLDHTVIFWNTSDYLPNGSPLTSHNTGVTAIKFNPDGKFLVSAGVDKIVLIAPVKETTNFIDAACELVGRNLTLDEWQTFFGDRPYHQTCPDLKPSIETITALLELGYDTRIDHQISTSKWAYKTASQQALEMNDLYINQKVCWEGGLQGYPEIVLSNCNLAVTLAEKTDPKNVPLYLRGRGAVLARQGKKQSAIEDLQSYVDWCQENKCTDDTIKQYKDLITALKTSKKAINEDLFFDIYSRSLYFD